MLRWRRAACAVAVALCTTRAAAADLTVYGDAVAAGWQDWSWGGVTRDFAHATPVHTGTASIAVTFTGGWSGLQLGRNDPVDTTGLDVLRCWVHGGGSGGQQIQIQVGNNLTGVSTTQSVTPVAGTWTQIDVPLAPLGTTQITYMYWFNNTAGAQPVFYVDDVAFVASGNPTPTPLGPVSGPALSVDTSSGRHPIDPNIYGMNFPDEGLATELRLPVGRWGGNATTRYNWQTDTANHASDWYFENIPNDNANPGALPDGSSSDQFIDQNQRTGTDTLLTVPLIGWTPHGRAYACGFSVAKYGAQQSTDPYRPDCGNGVLSNGADVTGNTPGDTSDAITPSFVQAWMQHLISRYGSAAGGGVRLYDLDNEPMLWADTHRDVHPAPPSYDELRDRTLAYAAAIKSTDPDALTLGPAEWGWSGYFWSALDAAPGGAWWNNPQDRLAHGNVPLVEWYLQQLRAYEQSQGVRILDYLDLHYYPQASGVALSPAGSAATQALRLRSTRSLWDPTYTDESWIAEPVYLIPRMRGWAASDYPGTKVAVGEYNWGALDNINGALAQADVLGIFGREGADLATLWDPPTAAQPGAFAFRMYRNYDGNGSTFGDVAVAAAAADQGTLAVYGAVRNSDGALTLMVINKANSPQISTLTLTGFTPASSAAVYRYSAASPGAIVHAADQPVTGGGFTRTFDPASVTLLVLLPASGASSPTPTPTGTPPAPTKTPTPVPSATPTVSATRTRTLTATATRTATPTAAASRTATSTQAPLYQVGGTISYYAGNAGVAGVSVALQGSSALATATGADGGYSVAGLAAGNWQVAPSKSGGRGNGISALDAAYILQAVAGLRQLDAQQTLAGDVTGDGTVSALDAARVLQYVVGLIPQLPVAQLCASDWLFVPDPAPAPPVTALPPGLGGGLCQPGALSFAPLAANAAAENFRAILLGDVTGNWQAAP